MSKIRRSALMSAIVLFAGAGAAEAAPVVTFAAGAGPAYSPFPVSNTDLLQTSVASVTPSGNFTAENAGGVPVLTNGEFRINGGNVGAGGDQTINQPLATVGNGASIVYNLNTATSPLGYNIQRIETFGGWNDAGRDKQYFTISYSLVGSDTFTPFDTVDADNPAAPGGPSAVQAVFNGTAALTGVDAIRFDFPSTGSTQQAFPGQENGYAGLGEIDVIGSPVPEPGTLALAAIAASAASLRRRRPRA